MAEDSVLRLSAEAQAQLVGYCRTILENHHAENDIQNKFEFIDIAYARYKQYEQSGSGVPGEDVSRELEECGINLDEITVPVAVSHVDSYVGYFSDVYLSGYPIFPVVSSPETRREAEALQSIIDTHATQGRYARQLLMSFYDDAKYNFSALEVDWCPLDDYAALSDYEEIKTKRKVAPKSIHYNKVKRIDPYNFIFDRNVLPGDLPYCGEFSGYIELISLVELKKRLAYYATTGNGYNTSQAIFTTANAPVSQVDHYGYYKEAPTISNFLTQRPYRRGLVFDWDTYLTGKRSSSGRRLSNVYECTTLYCRIIPDMFKMGGVPAKGTPQVWKLVFINHEKLVYAARQYNIYDTLPTYIGQPFEDGLGMQSQSVAEGSIPFQSASSKLFAIRMNSARRAVMDRAIYDPKMINPSFIDTKFPAAKIPIRDGSRLSGLGLNDAYYQIPFDSRGTETVIADMAAMLGMADRMNGINQPLQGQFQKGNKSRKEWEDTMAGATNRPRLRTLSLEFQQLLPVKEQIKFNLYQFGVAGNFQNTQSGNYYNVDARLLAQIKDKIGNFQLADGFHPAEKLAATEVLAQGMQMVSSSPILQQALGAMLPQMWTHLMSLGGVKGLDQYLPQNIQQPQQGGPQGTEGENGGT